MGEMGNANLRESTLILVARKSEFLTADGADEADKGIVGRKSIRAIGVIRGHTFASLARAA
jgi:hypothetical protein